MTGPGVVIGVAVASSTASRFTWPEGYTRANSPGKLSLSKYESSPSEYVSAARLDWLQEHLSERDLAVVRDVARVRLVTGEQLERLHFVDLGGASQAVVRRRVLGRLVNWRVLATFERRIGGARAGSAGLMYALDVAGQRISASDARARRPSLPGVRYVRHVLAVSELYVNLACAARKSELRIDVFEAEPACWWPDGRGGVLKPDAYAAVGAAAHTDHWWVEVDLATEHLPTLKRKLMTYADFWRRGQLGPDETMPRVLVTVPDTKRYSDVVRLIRQLPAESEKLIVVSVAKDAVNEIVRCLNESD